MFLLSCSKTTELNGSWKVELKLQDQILPVLVQLTDKEGKLSGKLLNSDELIPITGIRNKNQFELEIGTSYAVLKGEVADHNLTGEWVRTNRDDYRIPFTGNKTTKEHLYKEYENETTLLSMQGKWKIKLDDDKFGLGLFTQNGRRVQGSILTETGDYRYLDGYLEGDKLKLYGFDGTFSFVINGLVKNDTMHAHIFAGKSYNKEIIGTKDNEFSLPNASELTKIINKEPLQLSLKDLEQQQVSLDDEKLKDKAKIIQIFGSWCPNCIDELNYFISWRKEHKAKLNDVAFVAVAFENFKDEPTAIKTLKKLKHKMQMDYPILLGDYKSTKTVTKVFPIDKTRAFPTTLFLNKKNEIIKVHTGFSGQATGSYFKNFQVEFNETIDKLIQ